MQDRWPHRAYRQCSVPPQKRGLSAPSSNKQLVEAGASPWMSSVHIRVRAAWSATDFMSMSNSYTFIYLQVAVIELLWRLQPLRQPMAMVWAKARGSMDEVRWYILRRSSSFSGPGVGQLGDRINFSWRLKINIWCYWLILSCGIWLFCLIVLHFLLFLQFLGVNFPELVVKMGILHVQKYYSSLLLLSIGNIS